MLVTRPELLLSILANQELNLLSCGSPPNCIDIMTMHCYFKRGISILHVGKISCIGNLSFMLYRQALRVF